MTAELEAYERWLCQKRLVSKHRVRFFSGWVERFLRLRSVLQAMASDVYSPLDEL
jgi:hypothetical protein